VVILSLGASSYGATRPDFHLLDLHRLLLERGVVTTPPAAVSLGGEGDVGGSFDSSFRAALLEELRSGEVPLIEEGDLAANVARRLEIYATWSAEAPEGAPGASRGAGTGGSPKADPGAEPVGNLDVETDAAVERSEEGSGKPTARHLPVAAFVNVGGSDATLGTSPRILEVPPGLTAHPAESLRLPPPEDRGVLFQMAALGVPVIHLLNLRGLALRHGLPWDPATLPEPGSTRLRTGEEEAFWTLGLLTVAYLGALLFLALYPRPPRCGGPVHPVVCPAEYRSQDSTEAGP
jgi:hypothetical protein